MRFNALALAFAGIYCISIIGNQKLIARRFGYGALHGYDAPHGATMRKLEGSCDGGSREPFCQLHTSRSCIHQILFIDTCLLLDLSSTASIDSTAASYPSYCLHIGVQQLPCCTPTRLLCFGVHQAWRASAHSPASAFDPCLSSPKDSTDVPQHYLPMRHSRTRGTSCKLAACYALTSVSTSCYRVLITALSPFCWLQPMELVAHNIQSVPVIYHRVTTCC